MHVQLLIDSIVRQTTVLIAQLATSGGVRAPLAHVANQVFMDLAAELERQGLSRKVTADMFGISLRSYQRKVQRLRESSTDHGRSLWEAMIDYLESGGVGTRAEVRDRFHRDSEASVAAILRDMVDAGLVFCTGSGAGAVYRLASEDELRAVRQASSGGGLLEFVWAHVYRHGPLTAAELSELVKVGEAPLRETLTELVDGGRVEMAQGDDGEPRYASRRFLIGSDAPRGWEASVYDHFQAMVTTIGARLSLDPASPHAGHVGGSTYTFDVGPDHPLRAEALQTLSEFRKRCSELRERIADHNGQLGAPAPSERVVVYAGQSVIVERDGEGD